MSPNKNKETSNIYCYHNGVVEVLAIRHNNSIHFVTNIYGYEYDRETGCKQIKDDGVQINVTGNVSSSDWVSISEHATCALSSGIVFLQKAQIPFSSEFFAMVG